MASPHTLPAIHTLHLADLVARWEVSRETLLADLGLDEDALSAPEARLPLDQVVAVLERARALTGEPGLGFYLGLHMRVASHGYVGLAAMSAANVGDALQLAERFAPTRTSALVLRVEREADEAALVIEERASFGSVRDIVVFALMTGIWQIGNAVTGTPLRGRADVAFPEPPYMARFARLVPGPIRFDQPEHRLRFDATLLERPLVTGDPAALRLTRQQCERELEALGFDARSTERVTRLLPDPDGGFRTLADVARALHVSPRTLKRRLADEGVSFTQLLEAQRRGRAEKLLARAELSLDEIADRLGYSDAANFSRAFRRWFGMTPGAYRRDRRSRSG